MMDFINKNEAYFIYHQSFGLIPSVITDRTEIIDNHSYGIKIEDKFGNIQIIIGMSEYTVNTEALLESSKSFYEKHLASEAGKHLIFDKTKTVRVPGDFSALLYNFVTGHPNRNPWIVVDADMIESIYAAAAQQHKDEDILLSAKFMPVLTEYGIARGHYINSNSVIVCAGKKLPVITEDGDDYVELLNSNLSGVIVRLNVDNLLEKSEELVERVVELYKVSTVDAINIICETYDLKLPPKGDEIND